MKKIIVALMMVLLCIAALPISALAVAAPEYITDIAITHKDTTDSDQAKNKLKIKSYTVVDMDLNINARGDYIYMGYKRSSDIARAITGIIFREGENPPDTITDRNGFTFNLVGESKESNATGDGAVDLNDGDGGTYIYTYITRDKNYDYPLMDITAMHEESFSDYKKGMNTDGYVQDLNNKTRKEYALYFYYRTFEAYDLSNVCINLNYVEANGNYTNKVVSGKIKDHTKTFSITPDVPKTVTYDGHTFTLTGWRDDVRTYYDPTTQTPSAGYGSNSITPKSFYVTYLSNITVTYDVNGGSGAPGAETKTVKARGGSKSGLGIRKEEFTISSTRPTNSNRCKFLGWSTDKNATTAQYSPGQKKVTFKTNTMLYAVWCDHDYGNLVPAQQEVHTSTELKAGVDAHYYCSGCQTYFDKNKVKTTLEALTGTTPQHSFGNWINTDPDKHWKECSCWLTSQEGAHVYDNDRDTNCNTCGHVRMVLEIYTVSFDANCGTGTMPSQAFTEGIAQKLSANQFTREGCSFEEWNTAADGATLTASSSMILYAQWKVLNPHRIINQPTNQFVVEGQRAEFSIEAAGDGLSYQWYVNRNDCLGWQELEDVIGNAYVTSVTDLACNGFQYGCAIADKYDYTLKSDVVTLHVSAIPALTETGDSSTPTLWLAMSVLSLARVLFLGKEAYGR